MPNVPADTTHVQMTMTDIPGTAGKTISADIAVIDQSAHRLYIADRTTSGIDVFDVASVTPKFVATWKTPSTPNGVVVAKNRVVAGLTDSSVVSIDTTSGQVVGTVNTGGKKRADELDYDPKDNKVYVANSDDNIVSVIDMASFKIIKKFSGLNEALEQPRYDSANGKMYVTGDGTMYVFDPATDTQLDKIATGKCAGIDINVKTNQGVIGCAPAPIVFDFKTDKKISTIDKAGVPDGLQYDAKTDQYLLPASHDVHGPVMSILGGEPITFETNVPGTIGHQVAVDETNGVAYTVGPKALVSFKIPTAFGSAAGASTAASTGASAGRAGAASIGASAGGAGAASIGASAGGAGAASIGASAGGAGAASTGASAGGAGAASTGASAGGAGAASIGASAGGAGTASTGASGASARPSAS